MVPLIILLSSFGLLWVFNKFILKEKFERSFIGRIALALVLLATGIAHFTTTNLMIQMMPEFFPAKKELVYLTGICELLAVVGLLWNKTSKLTAVMLIIFFLAILPANIIGSMKEVQIGGMKYGTIYLLFRVPLQILLIGWTYYFGFRLINKVERN